MFTKLDGRKGGTWGGGQLNKWDAVDRKNKS